jgi:putative endonuclease
MAFCTNLIFYKVGEAMSWKDGVIAEDFVVKHLKAKGWLIEARNFRRKGHELDIIASRGDRLVCIEVKGRSSMIISHPAEILRHQKLGKLETGMLMWLSERSPEESRNAEFWLCSVALPISRGQLEWVRIKS